MRIVNKLKKVIGLFRIQNVVEVSVPVLSVPDLLVGRCALITGGTSGIGLAIAKAFIRAGAYVIITGRSQKRIERTLSDINSPQCEGIVLNNTDVSSFEEILTNLVQQTKREKNMDIDISKQCGYKWSWNAICLNIRV